MPNSLPRFSPLVRRIFFLLLVIAAVTIGWMALSRLFRPGETDTSGEAASISALQLNISDGDVFNDPTLNLTGTADPGQLVLVNGQPVPVGPSGMFELTLRLAEGPNLIVVEARDESGSVLSIARQVTYTPSGEEPPPPEQPAARPSTGLLALALGMILLAVLFAAARRRRPWVRLTAGRAEYAPGSPVRPGAIEIVLELDRPTRISIFVETAGGEPVKTLLNNRRRRDGRHTHTWDGNDASGRPVPPGAYHIRVDAGVFPAKVSEHAEVSVLPR